MIGVTIGVGAEWYKVARVAADRMEAMTGLECIVIVGEPKMDPYNAAHPSWLKCKVTQIIPHAKEFLLFDADLFCKRKWHPERLFAEMGRAFCAVPDLRSDDVFNECNRIGVAFPDVYLNGGLLMFGREHQPIWDAVWERHPGPFGKWLEQGALNIALLDSGCDICRLPRIFNTLIHKGNLDGHPFDITRAINVHFCAVNHPESLLKLQAKVKIHESDQYPEDTAGVAGDAAKECGVC